MRTQQKFSISEASKICDKTRRLSPLIRHVGYYDALGRIVCDSIRENTASMENEEEKHILNGTVAETLNLWDPSKELIGETESIILIRKKVLILAVPTDTANYFLAVFDKKARLADAERIRRCLERNIQ